MGKLYNIEKDKDNKEIFIYQNFDPKANDTIDSSPKFNKIGDEYIIKIECLEGVVSIDNFYYDSLYMNENRYLFQYYRISTNGKKWTEWSDLNKNVNNFPKISSKKKLYIEIKWVRKGDSELGTIKLLNYKLIGKIERNESLLSDYYSIIGSCVNKVLRSPFVFKVFNLIDYEVIPKLPKDVNIKYRFSQDNTRSWSEWEILNKENISTVKINPIRFFQVEYLIENKSNSNVKINDINLIGEFQDITNDYQKSNLYGVRECCRSNQHGFYDENGYYHPPENLNQTSGEVCDASLYAPLTNENMANLFNPYDQKRSTKLLGKLSSDSEQMFGHDVTYFVTDADKNGQDFSLNEYQLYNISCKNDVKVSIEGNEFPDSQIKMNIFDLDLFDTMEAHITKEQFKKVFGVQRRPSKEDFLYFCQINRMYQVDHAQQFRGFNNSAVYYKLVLKKYNQKANVKADEGTVKNELDKLVKNSTIDELFGQEQDSDKKSIANKKANEPLSRDSMRVEYFADINKGLIENGPNVISKYHYDLSSVGFGEIAVEYKNFNPILRTSDNLSIQIWFNINNYLKDEVYTFISNYDDANEIGWKSYLKNDCINIKLNKKLYEFNLGDGLVLGDPEELEEDTWYCYLFNLDQRNKKMYQYIYKRDVDFEEDAPRLSHSLLREVYFSEKSFEPIKYVMESKEVTPKLVGSDMNVTNIRLFDSIVPKEIHNKVLNQYIIGSESKYLIFSDNATKKLDLPRFPLNGE